MEIAAELLLFQVVGDGRDSRARLNFLGSTRGKNPEEKNLEKIFFHIPCTCATDLLINKGLELLRRHV
jgi:hypothetical protein